MVLIFSTCDEVYVGAVALVGVALCLIHIFFGQGTFACQIASASLHEKLSRNTRCIVHRQASESFTAL